MIQLLASICAQSLHPEIWRRVLIIAPHPDDEIIGCAGLMQRLIAQTSELNIVVLTGGGAAHPPELIDSEQLIHKRRQLMLRAASIIQLPAEHYLELGWDDGRLAEHAANSHSHIALARIISRTRPAAVFLPHPSDIFPDHRAATLLLAGALAHTSIRPAVYHYLVHPVQPLKELTMGWRKAHKIHLDSREYNTKQLALQAYFNEIAPFGEPYSGAPHPALLKTMNAHSEIYIAAKKNFQHLILAHQHHAFSSQNIVSDQQNINSASQNVSSALRDISYSYQNVNSDSQNVISDQQNIVSNSENVTSDSQNHNLAHQNHNQNHMNRLLIIDTCLTTYRIDLQNSLAQHFSLSGLLTGSQEDYDACGFDLSAVNALAHFPFVYHPEGFRVKGHLLSLVYLRVIRKVRPKIVITNELGAGTIIAALLRPFFGFKLYTTVDDSPDMLLEYSTFRQILRSLVVRLINGMLLVHPEVRRILAEKYRHRRCKFYYLPIIQSDSVLREHYRRALPISASYAATHSLAGKKVILFVGRLIDIKMPELLLSAFATLQATDPTLRLVMVGSGALDSALKRQSVALKIADSMIFTGYLGGDALYAWYSVAQILVLPSRRECFGAVVNEALVAGCRAVVSSSVGAGCLVNDNNGAIFQTANIQSLTNVLGAEITKIAPLGTVALKPNLMNSSFDDTVQQFCEFIHP